MPIRHRGGLHGIFKSGWDAARTMKALDGRAPRQCSKCGNWCLYDGWDHTHANGVGIESCVQSSPVQVSREELAQLLNSHQLWGRLVADPDDWEDYASDDTRAAHLKTADAILTLLNRESVQDVAPTQPE